MDLSQNLLQVHCQQIVNVGIYFLACLVQTFITQCYLLMTVRKKAFENIVGEGESGGHQHFLLFPQCFVIQRKDFE